MNVSPPVNLPTRTTDAHKGHFGRVMLVGGSRGMSGSVALSSTAALRCGSGLVTAAVPDCCLETVAGFHPCLMTLPLPNDANGSFALDAVAGLSAPWGTLSAVGCGPGMTTGRGSLRIVERLLLARSIPRVLDADAINGLAMLGDAGAVLTGAGPLVLTPHPGELERLTGIAASDRAAQVDAAEALALRAGIVILVKGGPSVVVDGSTRWTNSTGNPGMATAGSGDVLTGVIASLLGQGLTPWEAACLGVWVHGRAGDLAAERHGQPGMTAVEILDAIPAAIRLVTTSP